MSHAELIRVQCERARLLARSRDPARKVRHEEPTAWEKGLMRSNRDPDGSMGRGWEKWALTNDLSAANRKALRKRYPATPF